MTSAFAGTKTKRQMVRTARHLAECSKGWRLRQETSSDDQQVADPERGDEGDSSPSTGTSLAHLT